MRTPAIVASVLCSLLAAPALVPPPAGAVPVEVGQHTIFDTHVPGTPTTAEAWRTLRAVSAETDWRTGEVEVTAVLQGAIGPLSQVSVAWNLGRWSASGTECVPEKSVISSITADGGETSLSATRSYADVAHDYTCLDVSLTTGGVVTDRMRDTWSTRIEYSGAEADLASSPTGEPVPTGVLAGKPTKTLVLVRSHVLSSDTTRVTGSGRVAVEPLTVTGLGADEVRPVVARLTAPSRGRFDVALQARDERGDADYDGTSRVRAFPVSGRPDAGRFSDGAGVRFRVDGAGRVRALVASVPSCSAAEPRRVRLSRVTRVPRTGASAVARRVGAGWTAVQLLTRDDRRISGVVVRATRDCLQVVPFLARRAR